jgi:hypothetical protein
MAVLHSEKYLEEVVSILLFALCLSRQCNKITIIGKGNGEEIT